MSKIVFLLVSKDVQTSFLHTACHFSAIECRALELDPK